MLVKLPDDIPTDQLDKMLRINGCAESAPCGDYTDIDHRVPLISLVAFFAHYGYSLKPQRMALFHVEQSGSTPSEELNMTGLLSQDEIDCLLVQRVEQ